MSCRPNRLSVFVSKLDGSIRYIYADEAQSLMGLGDAVISRASMVEPTADGEWVVDLSPVGGSTLLGPFTTRKEALQQERVFLLRHGIPIPPIPLKG